VQVQSRLKVSRPPFLTAACGLRRHLRRASGGLRGGTAGRGPLARAPPCALA